MSGMTLELSDFTDNGNSRTYTLPGHTIAKPRLVIQRRKVAASVEGVAEDSVRFIRGTTDAQNVILSARDSIEVVVRRPANGDPADPVAMIADFRNFVISDEFANLVGGQKWIK